MQDLSGLTESQKVLAHDMKALLPGIAQAVTKIMDTSKSQSAKKRSSGKARAKQAINNERENEDRRDRLAHLVSDVDKIDCKPNSPYLQGAIKIFLHNILDYEQNEDFIAHRSAKQEEIEAFLSNNGPGPNLEDLHFDMNGGLGSDWNKRAFYLLTEQFYKVVEETKLPTRSKAYIRKMITEQFTRLATIWKNGQRKTFDDGIQETNEELEGRWTELKDSQTHKNRHIVRRFNVRLIVPEDFPLFMTLSIP